MKDCKHIKEGIELGLGKPLQTDNLCVGYACGPDDDEPHDVCKPCKYLADNNE